MSTKQQNTGRNTRSSRQQLFLLLVATVASFHTVHAVPGFIKKSALNPVPSTNAQAHRLTSSFGPSVTGGSAEANITENAGLANTTQLLSSSETPLEKSTIHGTAQEWAGSTSPAQVVEEPGPWPCMDELDKQLIKISLPVIANFAISPLVGAIDLFFINRLGNALAVAGQAASNQVFGSVFWLTSFLPSITAIEVSRESAQGNEEGVQEAVCRALFVGIIFAFLGSGFLLTCTEKALSSVLKSGAPALEFARPYLKIRAISFLPSLISIVGFSAFRGQMDTATPVRISFFANIFHALLVPMFIFKPFSMGVSGAALATLIAETISAFTYLVLMTRKKLINMSKIFQIPEFSKIRDLMKGGLALQLRNVAFNLTFISVTRMTQAIDSDGVAPAAHAMALQTFQVGGIVLLALSVVAQTVVPAALVETYDDNLQRTVGGLEHARATVNRLMSWGVILGAALGSLQIVLMPLIMKSTPLQEVRDAARLPAYFASVFQIINGSVFIGEGVMVGTGSFLFLSLSTAIASVGCVGAMRSLAPRFGLTGIWMGFGVFNGIRLLCVLLHQYYLGPLARRVEETTKAKLPVENEEHRIQSAATNDEDQSTTAPILAVPDEQ
ncbi:Protein DETOXIFICATION [Seminavis robusta]|uniref:Protein DETOXIFICATION n=1 Tax=Seminavis robusta TaxID=568900 RepID=A0A9N8H1V3_9STRA|nr:Protein DETOXIFICATION [Seminavis robusta]|eukprot:Sro49_g028870.1 Protein DETOXIFICATION (613) ;mRNA; r:139373-141555